MEFTPAAAYIHFSRCFHTHFQNHGSVDVQSFERADSTGKIVEASVSVQQKNKKTQLYRVNMYNSTLRVEVNGKSHTLFIDDLNTIAQNMSAKAEYQKLNTKIKDACHEFLARTTVDSSRPGQTTTQRC